MKYVSRAFDLALHFGGKKDVCTEAITMATTDAVKESSMQEIKGRDQNIIEK